MLRTSFVSSLLAMVIRSAFARQNNNTCFVTKKELEFAIGYYLSGNEEFKKQATDSYGSPMGSWCVSRIDDFSDLFRENVNFNEDINDWDVSNAYSLSQMFYGAINFNQPLNKWNTSKVEWMNEMFTFCILFNQDLSSWDVSKVISMQGTFKFAEEFDGNIASWRTSNVEDMSELFLNAVKFNSDISMVRTDFLFVMLWCERLPPNVSQSCLMYFSGTLASCTTCLRSLPGLMNSTKIFQSGMFLVW